MKRRNQIRLVSPGRLRRVPLPPSPRCARSNRIAAQKAEKNPFFEASNSGRAMYKQRL
jgi:hypothetical protein